MALPIKYPNPQEWQKRYGAAIVAAEASKLSPELGAVVRVVGAVLEDKIGDIAKQLSKKAAAEAAQLVNGIFSGTLKLSPQLVGQLGKLAGAVGTLAPLFGQVWGMAEDILRERDAAIMAKLKARTEGSIARCRAWLDQPRGTGAGGVVTPADMFRAVWDSKQTPIVVPYLAQPTQHHYPLSVAGLMCALCGEHSPLGWNEHLREDYTPPGMGNDAKGATTRQVRVHAHGAAGYKQWIAQVHAATGNSALGLSSAERKRLASVIQGILGSVRPWNLTEKVAPVGDQGRSLWPVAMDLLLSHLQAGKWNKQFLRMLQESQLRCYSVIDYTTGARIAPVVDLAPSFEDVVGAWKYTLHSASAETGSQKASKYLAFTGGAHKLAPLSKAGVRRLSRRPLRGAGVALAGAAGLAFALLAARELRRF